MFCPKCGTQLPDGTAFCSSCGANLTGGPNPNATNGAPNTTPHQPSAVGIAFSGLGGFLKSYLASPVQATSSVLQKRDAATPALLLGAQAIAAILMLLAACVKIGSMTYGLAEVPFKVWFFGGLLSEVICVALFMGLIFGAVRIMNANTSFLDVMMACGCHSIFITAMMLVTMVCFFLSLEFGFYVMLLTLVLWIAMGVPTFQAVAPEFQSGKAWIFYLVVVILTLVFNAMILLKGLFPALLEIPSSYNIWQNLM